MRIIFAGTPEFAAVALARLHAAGFDIPLVLTQPDRPAGRGLQPKASAVKQFALAHGIPVAQPASLRPDGKDPDQARRAHELLRETPHDAMVVAAYGLILPSSVLAIPRLGCLNIHASLLPRWRGAAPIHRAIEAGDTETGVAIMQMDAGLDTGPTLMMQRIPISPHDTTASLHDKLADMGAAMIVEALEAAARADVQPLPQPDIGVTYARKISKDEAALDFTRPAEVLERQIRAFNPFPGAFGLIDGTPIKIWGAETVPPSVGAQGRPGEVIAADPQSGVIVACGKGALRLSELQKPGGKRLPVAEFLAGFPMLGKRFA